MRQVRSNVLTVDVEDYFHVSAFDGIFDQKSWDNQEHRVEKNTAKLLDLFAKRNATATFFCLGWVAEKYPTLIRRIHDEGHEVASHGYNHKRTFLMSKQDVAEDIRKSKQVLEDCVGAPVIGYRAPSFSINKSNEWMFDLLKELGFVYSSSTYPIEHDLYGVSDWPREPHKKGALWEFPISTIKYGKKNLGVGGGGYFRLYPYWFSKRRIERFINQNDFPFNFYFHPWEIDPRLPRVKRATIKSKFRNYVNLSVMEKKLSKLLKDYHWTSMKHAYKELIDG